MPQQAEPSRATEHSARVRVPVLGVLLVAGLLALTWGGLLLVQPESPEALGVKWTLGTITGVLMAVLFGLMGLVGVERPNRSAAAARWLVVGFFAYALVFVGLMLSYRNDVVAAEPELTLGLPTPTMWLLIGVWQLPWLLVGPFVLNYERWTLSADDLARFKALVRDSQSTQR